MWKWRPWIHILNQTWSILKQPLGLDLWIDLCLWIEWIESCMGGFECMTRRTKVLNVDCILYCIVLTLSSPTQLSPLQCDHYFLTYGIWKFPLFYAQNLIYHKSRLKSMVIEKYMLKCSFWCGHDKYSQIVTCFICWSWLISLGKRFWSILANFGMFFPLLVL